MPYWPPDTPPARPDQMPQAATSGPAPVPFGGDQSAGNAPLPSGDVTPHLAPGAGVLTGVTGNAVHEHPLAAPNVNPYDPGFPQAIFVGGDADPGGRDIVSGTVAGSVAAAHAWLGELQSDTYGQGSRIGDTMTSPPSPLDPGVGSLGATDPYGGYYDPPRGY